MNKCLVTGAAGFIGSNLCMRLLSNGCDVIAIDNGLFRNLQDKVNAQCSTSKISYCAVDISESLDGLDLSGVDCVIHTAAKVVTRESIKEPSLYHRVNVDGTFNVFERARLFGVKKFVYLSSGACYGQADVIPTSETALIKPMHPYALTKYLGEQLVLGLGKIYSIPTVSLRMYYVYGKGVRAGCVFDIFLKQYNKGGDIEIFGNGLNDFLYIDDAVDAILLAAEKDISGEVINIASGKISSMHDLARLFGENIIYRDKLSLEPDIIQADITKARCLLDWEPKIDLCTGVRRMLNGT